ncbi:MAG: hypothetical protein WAT09_04340, partial [Paracoccaceae bacterium]
MRALLSRLMIVLIVSLLPMRGQAQGWADQPFDPAPMSREDTATLQAALAFAGDYYGYADGVWNADSQTALAAWAARNDGSKVPLYRHLKPLIMALEDERVKSGWQLFYSDSTNVSYLHPYDLLKTVENKDSAEFVSADDGFSVMVRFTDEAAMRGVHDWFSSKAKSGSEPFRYNDAQLWITSSSLDEGMTAYARSDLHDGSWSTMSIVVRPEYFYHLNLMAASMTVGGSPATLMWTDGGVIDQLINGDTKSAAAAPVPSPAGDGPKDQVRRPRPEGVATAPDPEPLPEPEPGPTDVASGKAAAPVLGTSGPAPVSGAAPLPDASVGGAAGGPALG